MSKPANTTVLSFPSRVQLVQAEINKRVKQEQSSNPYRLRARLWCRWLMQEVA